MRISIWIIVLSFLLISGCREVYTPKPRTYFRIYYPEKSYKIYDSLCPFRFEIPVYSVVEPDDSRNAEPCWLNVHYIPFNAKLHLSYKSIQSKEELFHLTEDSRELVYQHTVKAEDIEEYVLTPKPDVNGILYDLEGNTATAFQFYLMDSTRHFIRGALYFSAKNNRDSLQPVIDFLEKDIQKMINTFEWKDD